MLGARAMALVPPSGASKKLRVRRQGGARQNAHVHILAIAAFSLVLAAASKRAKRTVRRSTRRYRGIASMTSSPRMPIRAGRRSAFRKAAQRIAMT